MKLPPHLASLARGTVVQSEIARAATHAEIEALGKDMDAALGALAVKQEHYCRDEVILALLTVVECMFYVQGRRAMDYDAMLAPALDHIATQYPNTREYGRVTLASARLVGPWVRPSSDYHSLVGGVINALQGRMEALVTNDGRLVFAPQSSIVAELRNHWFSHRIQELREQRGVDILKLDATTRNVIKKIDAHIAAEGDTLLKRGKYTPPTAQWYTDHADQIADKALAGQFAEVNAGEGWAGLTHQEVLMAIRPIYRMASRRVFAMQRAFLYMKHQGAVAPLVVTTVEVAGIDALAQQAAQAAGIGLARARAVIQSMVRTGREEKHGILAFPLVPLLNDRVAILPSAVLFSAWPAQQEKAAAKRKDATESLSRGREARHTRAIVDTLRATGFSHIGTNIRLVDPVTGQDITDLDVVAVNDQTSSVLVLQLKSFLTPSNLLEVDRADKATADAVRQCRLADANLGIVKSAVEAELGIQLTPGFSMRQVIVAEAIPGTAAPSPSYPAVSLEWLLDAIKGVGTNVQELWDRANDLPDAAAFVDPIAPLYELSSDSLRDLKLGTRAAVFVYAARSDVEPRIPL